MSRTPVQFRRRPVTFLLLVLALAVGGSLLLAPVSAGERSTGEKPTVERVVVGPGDTLWSIAVRIAGPEGDPRPVVDKLSARNGIANGNIFPGQALIVP